MGKGEPPSVQFHIRKIEESLLKPLLILVCPGLASARYIDPAILQAYLIARLELPKTVHSTFQVLFTQHPGHTKGPSMGSALSAG